MVCWRLTLSVFQWQGIRRRAAVRPCFFDVANLWTLYRQQTLFPLTIPQWNSLPEAVATAPSLASFQSRVQNHLYTLQKHLLLCLFSPWFACNIQSRVVEGLGLRRSGFYPGERYTSWIGLVWDLRRMMQGFFLLQFIAKNELLSFFPPLDLFYSITFYSLIHTFFYYIPLSPQCILLYRKRAWSPTKKKRRLTGH